MLTKIIIAVAIVSFVKGQPECICYEDLPVRNGTPIVVHEPQDGSGWLLVATWEGIIYVYNKDGIRKEKPFLDLTKKVYAYKEQGLVGFVTHPNFKDNRRFYVFYTNKKTFKLSQFMVSRKKPDIAIRTSEVVMIQQAIPIGIHHAGQVNSECIFFKIYIFLFTPNIKKEKITVNGTFWTCFHILQ